MMAAHSSGRMRSRSPLEACPALQTITSSLPHRAPRARTMASTCRASRMSAQNVDPSPPRSLIQAAVRSASCRRSRSWKRAGRRGGQVPRSGLAALQELCYGGDHLVQDRSAGGTTVQRVRVHVGVIGFVGLSLTLGPGLHDPGSAAPRAETVANADDYFPDSMGSRWRYR